MTTQSRIFEHGYSLILSSKYRKIRIASSVALITLYPLGVYLLTGRPYIALLLPLLYISYMPLLLLIYRFFAGRFGRSKFALSLAIGIPSLSSVIDLIISVVIRRVVAFLSIILFNAVMQCTVIIANLNDNDKKHDVKTWIGSTLPTLSLVPYQVVVSKLVSIPVTTYIIVDLLSLALAYLSTLQTFRIVNKTGGPVMLRLLSALLNSLADVREPFEREFSKLGEDVYTTIHLLRLRTLSRRDLLIVVPYLHFGPFSGTVGSQLMYDLVHVLERKTGVDVVLLHGVGSHELDVVDQESSRAVVTKCAQAALELIEASDSSLSGVLTTSRPSRICGKYICLTKVPLSDVDLVVMTRMVNASDDIPLEIYRKVRSSYTGRKLIMVDAQNGFEGSSEWLPEELHELEAMLRSLALQENDDVLRLKGAWTFRDVSYPEVGRLGVRALLLRYTDGTNSKKDVLLVVFDSNNIKRSLYNAVTRELSREDRIVEILTTDNHELVSLVSGKGYNVLGELTESKVIVGLVRDMLNELERKLEDIVSIGYKPVTVRVKVLGELGFNFIKTKLASCVSKARDIALILILPQVLCIAMFLVFLML